MKHDKAWQQKQLRNQSYALKYRQRVCENKACRHRSCKRGACRICGGKMKSKGGK